MRLKIDKTVGCGIANLALRRDRSLQVRRKLISEEEVARKKEDRPSRDGLLKAMQVVDCALRV